MMPPASRACLSKLAYVAGAALWLTVLQGPSQADPAYPFEGTWIRADRACTPTAVRSRVYTAKEVTSPRGHCAIRRVTTGSGVFELLEECRRNDRPMTVTETIRLTSPDSMTLKRQVSRLKIPRQLRYARCTPAATTPPTGAVKH